MLVYLFSNKFVFHLHNKWNKIHQLIKYSANPVRLFKPTRLLETYKYKTAPYHFQLGQNMTTNCFFIYMFLRSANLKIKIVLKIKTEQFKVSNSLKKGKNRKSALLVWTSLTCLDKFLPI